MLWFLWTSFSLFVANSGCVSDISSLNKSQFPLLETGDTCLCFNISMMNVNATNFYHYHRLFLCTASGMRLCMRGCEKQTYRMRPVCIFTRLRTEEFENQKLLVLYLKSDYFWRSVMNLEYWCNLMRTSHLLNWDAKLRLWIDLSQNWPLSASTFAVPEERCDFGPKKSSTPAGNINVGIIYHNLNRKNSVFALGQFNVSNWARPVNLDRLNLMSRKATSASPSLLMVEGTRFLPKLWDTRFVMSVAHRFYNLAKLSVASDFQTGMERGENLL